MDKSTGDAYSAMAAATANTVVLPPGVQVADKETLSPDIKEELKETGAGVDAQVDSTGHFTESTDEHIIGVNATEDLTGQGGVLLQKPEDATSKLLEQDLVAPLN